jgi:hypothetical protein
MLPLGITLMATGIIAPAQALLSTSRHFGTRTTSIIGIALVVLGLPLLVAALRLRSGLAWHRPAPARAEPWTSQHVRALRPDCRAVWCSSTRASREPT